MDRYFSAVEVTFIYVFICLFRAEGQDGFFFLEQQGWGVNEIRPEGRVQVRPPGNLCLHNFDGEVIATGDVPAASPGTVCGQRWSSEWP